MPTERLTAWDKRFVAAVVLIAAVSIVFVRANFFAGFPEASIDLKYSKDEITRRAAEFLQRRGLNITGFRNLTLFDPDDDARLYLERELDLREANRLMSGPVSVWRWRARWFRPPEKEEMIVQLSPDARLVGFAHIVPEAAPGARLEKAAARALAEKTLGELTSAPQRLIEEHLEERPARFDYTFTWEQEGFRVKDAPYRRTIVVQGGEIGRYEEFLYVPEAWQRDFARLRSRNELYSEIAQALYVPLVLAALSVLLGALRRREVPWIALVLLAGSVALLTVLNGWNDLPFFVDRTPTSSPYPETLLSGILQSLGTGLGVFLYVILPAAAGASMYRRRFPDRLGLGDVITRGGIRTKEFFLASVAGYGLAAAHIAYVVAFYIVGKRFGVWSPQDVRYSDLLSTVLPWLYPLAISLMAATSEEFWFRLFAIPLLARRLPAIAAIVIPAFVWGFLHANYPQQPAYIRGVEVGMIGVAAGFLMLRFGIFATLIWHYTVDAVLIGLFLIRADTWYFRLSGWLVGCAVAFPLLASLFLYRRNGGFAVLERPAAPVEETEAAPVEALAEPIPPRWAPLRLYLLAAVLAVGAVFLRPARYGADRIWLSRYEAESIAVREMAARAAGWMRATEFVPNLHTEDFEYIRRIAGPAAADSAVRNFTFTAVWRTRFFRPLEKEEYRVFLNQRGEVFRIDHLLDEKAPGANLSPDEARGVAERFLFRQGIPVSRYRLVDSQQEKRDRRTDHTFVWEDPGVAIGEARARVSVEIAGDEVAMWRRFLKLPEEWVRDFQRPRVRNFLLPALIGALAVPLVIVFLRRLSGHRYHWRAYLIATAAAFLVATLSAANTWLPMLARYDSATPFDSFRAQLLIGRAITVLLVSAAAFLGVLALDVFRQFLAGDRRLTRPSLWRAIAVAAATAGFSRVVSGLDWRIPGARLSLPLWNVTGADTAVPGLAALSQGFFAMLVAVCVAVIAVCAAVRLLGWRNRILIVGLAGVCFATGRAQTVPQWLFSFAIVIAAAGLITLIARTCAMDVITFAVALFWIEAAGPLVELIEQPAPLLRWTGIGAAIVAAGLGMWAVRFSVDSRPVSVSQ